MIRHRFLLVVVLPNYYPELHLDVVRGYHFPVLPLAYHFPDHLVYCQGDDPDYHQVLRRVYHQAYLMDDDYRDDDDHRGGGPDYDLVPVRVVEAGELHDPEEGEVV